jgi:hypothetical protein
LFAEGKAKWCAIATGPKGQYQTGESPVFAHFVTVNPGDGVLSLETEYPLHGEGAFAVLTGSLVRDGWVLVSRGSRYWETYYRRSVE